MDDKSYPQYAKVEQPFGCAPPLVHCPICGSATLKIGEEGGEVTACPHLAFIYVGEVGEFEYQSQDFEKRFSTIELEDLSLETFQKSLEQAGYDNKLLAIEITYGGMACGPVWNADIFGFDYGTLESNLSAE